MKHAAVTILLTALYFCAEAQNLVPNAGFEEYKHLPCEDGLYFMEALLYDWIQPIPTTPDYWNSLAEPDCLLNPAIVHDSARTGNGMIGIVTASFEAGSKSEYKNISRSSWLQGLRKVPFITWNFIPRVESKIRIHTRRQCLKLTTSALHSPIH